MPFTTKRKPVEPPPRGPAQEAPGVVYTSIASTPGLRMFACDAYRASLTIGGCASRWREAQAANATPAPGTKPMARQFRDELVARYAHCRGCKLGAAHAGQPLSHYSQWFGVSICPRCSKGTTRMIGNRRCVSCYNREREMAAGRNARGNAPVELMERPLHQVEILLEVDGEEVRRLVDRETTGVTETVVQALRTTKGELAFARVPDGVVDAALPPAADNDDSAQAAGPWALTETRCLGCGGRVLRNQAGGHRCADCGHRGEGRPDREDEWSPSRVEYCVVDDAPAAERSSYWFKICLLASTNMVSVAALRAVLPTVPPRLGEAAGELHRAHPYSVHGGSQAPP